jgi:hypothetical protein
VSNSFLSGLLSLAEADTEVAIIPAAQTFLASWLTAKDALSRAAAVAQLEGNVLTGAAALPAEFLGQTLPTINTTLQSVLAKAQATIAATKPPA